MKKLRGLVSLALVVALVMSCASAMAAPWIGTTHLDTSAVGGYASDYVDDGSTYWFDYGKDMLIVNSNNAYSWALYRYDEDRCIDVPVTFAGTNVPVNSGTYNWYNTSSPSYDTPYWSGMQTIDWDETWNGDNDPSYYYENGNGVVHRLVVTDAVTGQRKVFSFFVDDSTLTGGADRIRTAGWMWNNTVCSFGPHFWDYTDKTNKWYMFTPVDLSVDGVQTFEMVAGGMYKIGYVYVAVDGDNVTVTYQYVNPNEIYNKGEFFTLLPDLETPEVIDPDQMESMVYGQTYSIANDLGGDTSMLLFTCNRVNFLNSTNGIQRFYENIKWRANLRDQMVEMAGITPIK